MTVEEMTKYFGACREGQSWADAQTDARSAWESCTRLDWMLWALEKIGYNNPKALRLFACDCVRHTPLGDGRTTWDLLTDPRSKAAVEVAERYAMGKATDTELEATWVAARVAVKVAARDASRAAARAAAQVASRAAWDAAWAAAWDAARDAAWAAAWDAARDAAWAAAWAAAEVVARNAALDSAQATQADLLRSRVAWSDVEPLLAAIKGE